MIKITFPDLRVREYPEGVTGLEIAQSLSPQLAKEVLAITVNGEIRDLTRAINTDSRCGFLAGIHTGSLCLCGQRAKVFACMRFWRLPR